MSERSREDERLESLVEVIAGGAPIQVASAAERIGSLVLSEAGTSAANGEYGYTGEVLGCPRFVLSGNAAVVAQRIELDDESSIYAYILSASSERLYRSNNSIEDYSGSNIREKFFAALADLSADGSGQGGDSPAPTITFQPGLTGLSYGARVRQGFDGIVVENAGQGAANGKYTRRGIHNGVSYWNLVDEPDDPLTNSIVYGEVSVNRLAITANDGSFMYFGDQERTDPTIAEWGTNGGFDPPPPTVTSERGITYELEDPAHPESASSWAVPNTLQMVTTIIDTDNPAKQDLLPAVPLGKKRIVTQIVIRNATADLAAMGDILSFGFDGGAGDWESAIGPGLLGRFTDNTVSTTRFPNSDSVVQKVGVVGDVFGCAFADSSIDAQVTIDTFFYDVPA